MGPKKETEREKDRSTKDRTEMSAASVIARAKRFGLPIKSGLTRLTPEELAEKLRKRAERVASRKRTFRRTPEEWEKKKKQRFERFGGSSGMLYQDTEDVPLSEEMAAKIAARKKRFGTN